MEVFFLSDGVGQGHAVDFVDEPFIVIILLIESLCARDRWRDRELRVLLNGIFGFNVAYAQLVEFSIVIIAVIAGA